MPATTLTVGLPNFGGWANGDWKEFVNVAKVCDEAGVDRVVVNDHVVMGDRTDRYIWGRFPTKPDAPWLEPLTVLSAMAMVTSRVRLSTGILIAPLRPAPLLAKTLGTLDTLSSGRLDIGVGTGWQPEEYDAMGLSFDDRAQRLDDTIAACRELWSSMPASYASAHATFSSTYCAPQPVQERLPIWFAGALTRRNLTRVVELGDGWIPIMGASLEDIRAGADAIRAATSRSITVQAPLPMVTAADGSRDPVASMAGAPTLIEAGATDIYLNIAAFASSPAEAPPMIETVVSAFSEVHS